MKWITESIIKICREAEQDWHNRLPDIIARAEKTAEQWRDNMEYIQRWEQIRND